MNDNSGQAFPHCFGPETFGDCVGMTLRDYFAAKVLPAIYTDAMRDENTVASGPEWRYGIALDAYRMADAMLKAREA
jgi:hypothetical protein